MSKVVSSIGLYFGSFNPVHVGHLALANFIVENTELEEIWFVVSPQNPHKESTELIDATHRVKMLERSTKNYGKFKVCDIELQLPTPSYTYITLRKLSELHPDCSFTIIMGADNLPYLNRWKNTDEILNNYQVMVYPRPGHKVNQEDIKENITIVSAPTFDIDSTSIRKGIKEGKEYRFLIPDTVFDYIRQNSLYS